MPRHSLAVAILLVGLSARPASADITAFLGAATTPDNRLTRGIAVGASLLVVGFEVEFGSTSDDSAAGAPSLTTGTANLMLQTPVPLFGIQPYFTAGGGLYRETLDTHQDTSFAVDIGGGVKIVLLGPIRVRLDYRMFRLGSDALYSPTHRVYAGLNVAF